MCQLEHNWTWDALPQRGIQTAEGTLKYVPPYRGCLRGLRQLRQPEKHKQVGDQARPAPGDSTCMPETCRERCELRVTLLLMQRDKFGI